MTLEELKEELLKKEQVTVATGTRRASVTSEMDPCCLRSKHFKTRQVERLPGHLVLVQDEETGEVSYMRMFPDGHLGSLGGE